MTYEHLVLVLSSHILPYTRRPEYSLALLWTHFHLHSYTCLSPTTLPILEKWDTLPQA